MKVSREEYGREQFELSRIIDILSRYEALEYPSVMDRVMIRRYRRELAEEREKIAEKIVEGVYFRSSYAEMYYAEDPRTGKDQTPDPIAEFRVTVVSDRPGQYDMSEFRRVCIYTGVILAPQTYWIKQMYVISAYEEGEMVDEDELPYSVPVYERLNYCERYAIFFKSRQRPKSRWWRVTHPEWWKSVPPVTPEMRGGDYEYSEKFIKSQENRLIDLGTLRYYFDNETGVMEAV